MLFPPDPDHDPGDVIGAPRLGAPEAVAVGGESEFALGVSAARYRRLVWFVGSERAHLGIHHRFAVRGRELGGDLVLSEEIEGVGGRGGEDGYGTQKESTGWTQVWNRAAAHH